ncbi:MAG: hypothetical protein CMB80_32550 [Flammeovirgaceae bacterium]|nr:hypothetical protein [Flammeovirgaceae bacterium]
MPRRTAKISRPDNTNNEQEDIEIEPVEDDDIKENENELNFNDLKDLIFLGRLNKAVDISGYRFVISTLTTKQQRKVMQTVMQFDQLERLLDIKPVTVAYSVKTVNGVPLEELCEDEDIEDVLERRRAVISSLQAAVIEKLYRSYEELVSASNKEIGLEALKD